MSKKEKTVSKFKQWLQDQKEREDSVGRLAQALADKEVRFYSRRRRRDEHKKWADIVIRHGRREFIPVFNEAWTEYQQTVETS